jgi:hypothetical protein
VPRFGGHMKRLSIFVCSLICGVVLLGGALYAMEVVSAMLVPGSMNSCPKLVRTGCPVEDRFGPGVICRAA